MASSPPIVKSKETPSPSSVIVMQAGSHRLRGLAAIIEEKVGIAPSYRILLEYWEILLEYFKIVLES